MVPNFPRYRGLLIKFVPIGFEQEDAINIAVFVLDPLLMVLLVLETSNKRHKNACRSVDV